MMYGPGTRIIDISPQFYQFMGATLEWWGMGCSHKEFHLLATGLPRGSADLCFLSTEYLECPVRMHNVRLRMATREENTLLRLRLPALFARYLDPELEALGLGLSPQESHLVVECDEGTFWVWAGGLFIKWGEPHPRFMADRRGATPLWPGGPTLAEA
jgi:hypothetical protein